MDEVLFLRVARPLPRRTIVGMDMRGALRDRVRQRHVTFESLVQIAGLRNVDRVPIAFRQLPGVNINAGQRLKGSVKGVNPEGILPARLPGPIVGSR